MALLSGGRYPQDGTAPCDLPHELDRGKSREHDGVRDAQRLDVPRHRRDEVVARELVELGVRLRDDGRRPGHFAQERDLAEEVALLEAARRTAVGGDLDLS